jgi:hypothetical protein
VSSEKSKVKTTLPGKVEKVIQPHPSSGEPEKAQIAVEGADHLYREIRVPNRLMDDNGHKVKLKEGADVEVKIEADPAVTSTVANAEESGNQRPHGRA